MTMNLDDGAVDHRELQVRLIRASLEQALKDIRLHPVPKALELRVPPAERALLHNSD